MLPRAVVLPLLTLLWAKVSLASSGAIQPPAANDKAIVEMVDALVNQFNDKRSKLRQADAIDALKKLQHSRARRALIGLIEEMRPKLRVTLVTEAKPGNGYSWLEAMPPEDRESRTQLLKLFNSKHDDVRDGVRRAIKKYLIEREYIFEQCMTDIHDVKNGRAIHAWRWLQTAEPLIGRVDIADHDRPIVFGDKYCKDLADMASFEILPATPALKKQQKEEALKVLKFWVECHGANISGRVKYWLKVVENKEYHEADWKNCRHWAINNLAEVKAFKAIPGLVFRYKDVQDKDKVHVHLQRFAKFSWPKFDQALCDTFKSTMDKAKRIEVAKIMELEGGPGCFKTLTDARAEYKKRADDADLLVWIDRALAKVTVRKDKDKDKDNRP